MNEGEIAAGLSQTSNYRYAERVGDRLFVAGQVPRDGNGQVVGEGDPAAQARQCLDNLFAVLDHHGFGRGDIRRLTVYVVGEHRNLIETWGEVAATFAMEVPPATLLGVNLLGYPGQLVEIDADVMKG
jgi:enamine deaminase RidA (YjgF/YER057c/UK114 family)